METVELGGVVLQLGMAQAKVLDGFGKGFKVEKMDDGKTESGSSWMLTHDRNIIAILGFKDGRLDFISKEWGPEDQQKGVDFASSLYFALAQFVKEGKRSCVIDVGSNETLSSSVKTAFITCGGKYLDVTVTRWKDKNHVQNEATNMSEILREPR